MIVNVNTPSFALPLATLLIANLIMDQNLPFKLGHMNNTELTHVN